MKQADGHSPGTLHAAKGLSGRMQAKTKESQQPLDGVKSYNTGMIES